MKPAASTFTPHNYQREAIDFALVRLIVEQQKGAGIFLDPGLGKTSITLSVMEILKQRGELNRTLIVAPLRAVYKVWPDEIRARQAKTCRARARTCETARTGRSERSASRSGRSEARRGGGGSRRRRPQTTTPR